MWTTLRIASPSLVESENKVLPEVFDNQVESGKIAGLSAQPRAQGYQLGEALVVPSDQICGESIVRTKLWADFVAPSAAQVPRPRCGDPLIQQCSMKSPSRRRGSP